MNNIERHDYFSSSVYITKAPQFLDAVTEVSEEHLAEVVPDGELNEIYPVRMSDQYFDDKRITEFCTFVGESAWNILDSQGYDLSNIVLSFSEMWTQEHHKHSLMEQHVHNRGAQVVGFYFLETPEDCSRLLVHDPRAAKMQIDLPQKDNGEVTQASGIINFKPEPGMLVFTNAWLPHSFGRHGSDKPIKFVHFNLVPSYAPAMACSTSEVEVI